jgi:hypothetical protein
LSGSHTAQEKQPLQAVRGVVPGVLGELPAVLATDRPEQPAHVLTHPPSGLHAGERLAYTQQQ